MDSTFKFPAIVTCPHCSNLLAIEGDYIDHYLAEEPILCHNCKGKLDWWLLMCDLIRDSSSLYQAFVAVGAQLTLFKVDLCPGKITTINFEDHELPPDGRLLDIIYTPQGGSLFPIEIHGNNPKRHVVPRQVSLYPYPLRDSEPLKTDLNVLIVWVPHAAEDESWQNLVDAFEAYATGRFASAIVPANVAVESRLKRFLLQVLSQTASRKRVEDCLDNGATYSHQLNVVLPAILAPRNISPLPDQIRGALNRLRDLRNELAHSGHTTTPLDQESTAELMCAALFGFRYMKFIEGRIGGTDEAAAGAEDC